MYSFSYERCAVLATMFNSKFKESGVASNESLLSDPLVVKVEDTSPEAFLAFLEYLYSGTIQSISY